MAKESSNPKNQNGTKDQNSTKNTRTNSPKPLIPKAGVTHSGRKSY